MSDFTYFRIGVPNDMVADIMWLDEFDVSIESYSKHETNYQRYFGTPEKAAALMDEMCGGADCGFCPLRKSKCPGEGFATYLGWMEAMAE